MLPAPGGVRRYFAFTGYQHSTYLADEQQWLEVFASLGDSLSLIRPAQPQRDAFEEAGGSTGSGGDGPTAAAEVGAADGKDTETAASVAADTVAAAAAPQSRLMTGPPLVGDVSNASSVSNARSVPAELLPDLADMCISSSSDSKEHAFSALTVVLMGASPRTVATAAAWIQKLVATACCQGVKDATADESTSNNNNSAARCGGVRLPINIIPIGSGFTQNMGLEPTSPYYTLIVRNIAPLSDGTGPAAFADYLQQPHLAAWRLTPQDRGETADVVRATGGQQTNSGVTAGGARSQEPSPSLAAAVAAAVAAAAEALHNTASFPATAVKNRSEDADAVAADLKLSEPLRQQHQQLVQQLFDVLNQTYAQRGILNLTWGLGSVAPLAVLGVDWGLDCLQQQLDWCNGGRSLKKTAAGSSPLLVACESYLSVSCRVV